MKCQYHLGCDKDAIDGCTLCEIHKSRKQAKLEVYGTRWAAKIQSKVDVSRVANLREEVAIVRMMLEARLNLIKSEEELVIHSQALGDLTLKIEKLVASCHKFDKETQTLLAKEDLMRMIEQVIAVVSEEVKDADLLLRISDRIAKEIEI